MKGLILIRLNFFKTSMLTLMIKTKLDKYKIGIKFVEWQFYRLSMELAVHDNWVAFMFTQHTQPNKHVFHMVILIC